MRKTILLVCAFAVITYSECKIVDANDGCVFDTAELKSFLPTIQGAGEHFICHEEPDPDSEPEDDTEDGSDEESEEDSNEDMTSTSQYLTMFSKKYNMAVFSAAIVASKDKGNKGKRGGWTIKQKDWDGVTHPPKKEDYQVFSDFDKGHLFAYRYSNNKNQGKATMRIANAVPQDKVFNEIVWSKAEAHLEKKFIGKCNEVRNQFSVVVTGAVPSYYGKDKVAKDKKGNGEHNLRIGKTEHRNSFYKPTPEPPFFHNTQFYNIEMKDSLTVPTHMWTYAICLSKTDGSDAFVVDHTSFIGLNYRTGVVKWYKKFSDFLTTLDIMYASYATPQPGAQGQSPAVSIPAKNRMETDSKIKAPTEKINMCGFKAVLNAETMLCTRRRFVTEIDFWDKININQLRKRNERRRLNHLLSVYGVDFKLIEGEPRNLVQCEANSAGGGGNKNKRRTRTEINKRRKRSIQGNTTQAEPDILLTTVMIHDMDPDSNFDISECKIQEKSPEGKLKETHTYDFQKNMFIEDPKPGGSVLTAKYFVNGTEVEAVKEVSADTEINIVLSPRRSGPAPTTTTTPPATTAPTTTRRGHGG